MEVDGETQRLCDFSFRPITGALELRLQDLLHDCRANQDTHPLWISQFLTTVLARIATHTIVQSDEKSVAQGLALVRELCVADRHFLLLQWRLFVAGGSDYEWLSAHCPECEARYDFPLEWAELPIKPAGENFPQIRFRLSSAVNGEDEIQVRVPRGSDQEFIAQLTTRDATQLRRALLQRLILQENSAALINHLSDEHIVALESALEQASPEIAEQLQLSCPECGTQHQVQLDWYRGMHKPVDELLDQIHQLAANYHWSEQEILALPQARRMAYLQRLERARGISRWSNEGGAAL